MMTTEVLLNLVWLLIAAALLGAWRARWIHQRRASCRHSLREWSAVSLALVLLFFAVSMSDDLHAEIVALEDCSANRRDQAHVLGAHAANASGSAFHVPAWATAPRVGWFGPADAFGKTLPARPSCLLAWACSERSSRGPPVSFL
jgi:hypothetical protein